MGPLFAILLGCPSIFGLEELDTLPPDFPLALDGDLGNITRSSGGEKVSVDIAFDTEEQAREAWESLQAQAKGRGFEPGAVVQEKNRSTQTMDSTRGRLELGCCPRRADRRYLVFVGWMAAH